MYIFLFTPEWFRHPLLSLLDLLLGDLFSGLPSPFVTLSVTITERCVTLSLNDSYIVYLIMEALFTQRYINGAIHNDAKVNAK